MGDTEPHSRADIYSRDGCRPGGWAGGQDSNALRRGQGLPTPRTLVVRRCPGRQHLQAKLAPRGTPGSRSCLSAGGHALPQVAIKVSFSWLVDGGLTPAAAQAVSLRTVGSVKA